MKVAFLVNDLQLSGGVGVVTQHATRLSAVDGWEVSLVLVREPEDAAWHAEHELAPVRVISREQACEEHYDVALATWWETTFTLFELQADRYAYFVQSLEDRFYRHDEAERLGAALTLDLPVAFITEALWIAQTIEALRPGTRCYLVRNGIEKSMFTPPARAPINDSSPLRILIEGSASAWFKHVPAAIDAASAMREPNHVTVVTGEPQAFAGACVDEVLGPLTQAEMVGVYDRVDVVLKLSSVEGMFGPPLEGFHRGATCVVTPVTGHEEYVAHGWNGLITDWEDLGGTARQLDLLARDRRLLGFLRTNALHTARAWPSWEQSSQFMELAIRTIRDEAPPAGPVAAAAALADLRSGLEEYHLRVRERAYYAHRLERIQRRLRRFIRNPVVRWMLSLRRYKLARAVSRPLRPLIARLRRVFS